MARKNVEIELIIRGQDAKKTLNSIERDFGNVQRATTSTSRSIKTAMGAAFVAVSAIGVSELAQITKKIFETGSAVEETESKFLTSMGEQSEAAQEFLDQYATMLGLTDQQAKDFLATQNNIARGLGFTGESAFDLSKDVVKLAGDLASFNNIPIEQTLNAIRGGLVGEREALKTLGIVVREQDVVQRALNNTNKESAKALTDQEKATASLQLITERAGSAIGDLERTQDSSANQARQLQAEIGNLVNELSVALLPALAAGVKVSLEFVQNLSLLLDRYSDVRSEVELTTAATNAQIESYRALRDELAEASKEQGLTTQQQELLNESYDRSSERLKQYGSDLFDANLELKNQRTELQEQKAALERGEGAMLGFGLRAKSIKEVDRAIEGLTLKINGNEEALSQVTSELERGADSLDEHKAKTEEQEQVIEQVVVAIDKRKELEEEYRALLQQPIDIDNAQAILKLKEQIDKIDEAIEKTAQLQLNSLLDNAGSDEERTVILTTKRNEEFGEGVEQTDTFDNSAKLAAYSAEDAALKGIGERHVDIGKHIDDIRKKEEEQRQAREAANQQFAAQTGQLIGQQIMFAQSTEEAAKNIIATIMQQVIARAILGAFIANPVLGAIIAPVAAAAATRVFRSLVPGFADGVTDFEGGVALVGERGPELVTLGRGSNVITNENTERIISTLTQRSEEVTAKTFRRSVPRFASGVTGFDGGLALVGERGREMVTIPNTSNIITNENTQTIVSAISGQADAAGRDSFESIQASVTPDAIKQAMIEALESVELPLVGYLEDDKIRIQVERSQKKRSQRKIAI